MSDENEQIVLLKSSLRRYTGSLKHSSQNSEKGQVSWVSMIIYNYKYVL